MGCSNNPNNISCTHFLPPMRRTPIAHVSPQNLLTFHLIYHTVDPNAAHPVAQSPAAADPNPTRPALRVINVDKNAAYPKAEASLKAAGILPEAVELRQVKYLNNLVEQDHRFIKRLVKPGMGFFSVETAGRTLQGYEVMHMIRKGQVREVGKGDIPGQVTFIARLFGVAA